jgi:hypothetical protein
MNLNDLLALCGVTTLDELVDMFGFAKQSNALSHLKGIANEWQYKQLVERAGGTAIKVPDNDRDRRFDFESVVAGKPFSAEVKTVRVGKTYETFDVKFRDAVVHDTPDGPIRSHQRRATQRFDLVALSLVNRTGRAGDFCFIPFSALPTEWKHGVEWIKGTIRLSNVDHYFSLGEALDALDRSVPASDVHDSSGGLDRSGAVPADGPLCGHLAPVLPETGIWVERAGDRAGTGGDGLCPLPGLAV